MTHPSASALRPSLAPLPVHPVPLSPPVTWPRSSFTVRPFPSPHTSVAVRLCHLHLCDNPGPRPRPPRGPFCLRAL